MPDCSHKNYLVEHILLGTKDKYEGLTISQADKPVTQPSLLLGFSKKRRVPKLWSLESAQTVTRSHAEITESSFSDRWQIKSPFQAQKSLFWHPRPSFPPRRLANRRIDLGVWLLADSHTKSMMAGSLSLTA
eukprot:1304937-Rhodomonas_salina.2